MCTMPYNSAGIFTIQGIGITIYKCFESVTVFFLLISLGNTASLTDSCIGYDSQILS